MVEQERAQRPSQERCNGRENDIRMPNENVMEFPSHPDKEAHQHKEASSQNKCQLPGPHRASLTRKVLSDGRVCCIEVWNERVRGGQVEKWQPRDSIMSLLILHIVFEGFFFVVG